MAAEALSVGPPMPDLWGEGLVGKLPGYGSKPLMVRLYFSCKAVLFFFLAHIWKQHTKVLE